MQAVSLEHAVRSLDFKHWHKQLFNMQFCLYFFQLSISILQLHGCKCCW